LTKISDQFHQLLDTIDEKYIAHVQIRFVKSYEFPTQYLVSHFLQQKGTNHRKL